MSAETVQGLRRDAVGLRDVLFQSVTAMAPAAAVAASIPSGAAFAGGSLPLSVLIALVACLFTASCVAELARELPAAGSVATYAAQGLHPAVGFLVGWSYVFVEALVPPLLLLQLGFTTAGTLHQEWSSYPESLWWRWALAGAAIIAAAGWFGVRASARFGTVLGVFEILVFLVFALWLIGRAGSANTLSVFGTSHNGKDYSGLGGVFAGSVYTVLAFAGFEAAAPLAEETRDPRRTMHRAVLGAALGIGLFYVLTTYAMTVYYGPDRFAGFGASGAASWEGVARASFGLFWVLVFLAVVNSTIANANACATVSTRTAFALARIRVLPASWPRSTPATAPPSPESPCRPSSRWAPYSASASATTR
ncbi:APC family permease [Streptomyces galilaeus]